MIYKYKHNQISITAHYMSMLLSVTAHYMSMLLSVTAHYKYKAELVCAAPLSTAANSSRSAPLVGHLSVPSFSGLPLQ